MSDRKTQLKDMNQIPSDDCLLSHLFGKILSGELQTFAALSEYVSSIPVTRELKICLFRAFELQRKLHWGFFSEMTPKKYPLLWKEIVLPDRRFPFGGTLKRSMSIPSIYMGLVDIHGYTKFCSEQKRNISMVDLLDRMIYEDVDTIAAESGVLSRRARGDEILLIGGSATDILAALLRIMEYFNTQGRSFPDTILRKRLPGTVLPKFKISAGIAGGQKFTPLVITRDGDVSGDIVNTAARLQAKANRISPSENRIMLTNHVYQKIKTEKNPVYREILGGVDFFKVGPVEFKGVKLTVYDIIFLPGEEHRREYREPVEELLDSLGKKLWKSRVFNCALNLAARVIKVQLENLRKETYANDRLRLEYKALLEEMKSAADLFNDKYYETAIEVYIRLVEGIASLPDADPVVIQYLELVAADYQEIYNSFTRAMDEDIEVRQNQIFTPNELKSYQLLKTHKSLQVKLQSHARIKLNSRKILWNRTTDEVGDSLGTSLKSAK